MSTLIGDPTEAERRMIDVALDLLQETDLSAEQIVDALVRRLDGDAGLLLAMARTGCKTIVMEAGMRYVDRRTKAN